MVWPLYYHIIFIQSTAQLDTAGHSDRSLFSPSQLFFLLCPIRQFGRDWVNEIDSSLSVWISNVLCVPMVDPCDWHRYIGRIALPKNRTNPIKTIRVDNDRRTHTRCQHRFNWMFSFECQRFRFPFIGFIPFGAGMTSMGEEGSTNNEKRLKWWRKVCGRHLTSRKHILYWFF